MTADMTRDHRHEAILERLSGGGEVSAETLAGEFGVNIVTIRRDLAYLERQGLLRRTHGGAALSRYGTIAFSFQKKEQTHLAEKAAIASAAAEMVAPGMAVTLDTGLTTLELARRLVGVPNLKVLTSSLAIASVLYAHDNVELVLLGGTVRRGSPDLIGAVTEENLRRFQTDLTFLGADAVTREGLFTTDADVARVSQAMLARSRTAVLLIDSGKFRASAFVRQASWAEIGQVVTDEGAPAEARAWLGQVVRKVTYVEK